MRIGYPCINLTLGCRSSRKFRLASYSDDRLAATISGNLSCLRKTLAWNLAHGILFFRISSDLIPFASHPACTLSWKERFSGELARAGRMISGEGIRISMHPDQFVVLNSPDERIVRRSIAELAYHADLLDLMGLDATAKIQIHVGGLYGNPPESIARFVTVYRTLDPSLRARLVIENDETRFTAADCLGIHAETGVPVLFDLFHHACHNRGEEIGEMLLMTGDTWGEQDGTPMVDYSSQEPGKRTGAHAGRIDMGDFWNFLAVSRPYDRDVMLEIKDKESSALAAITAAREDPRFLKRGSLPSDPGSIAR